MNDEPADRYESPFNSIPDVVIALALAIGGIELAFSLSDSGQFGQHAVGWRSAAMQAYAMSAAVQDRVFGLGDLSIAMIRRYVTYLFVHGSFTQALFAVVIVAALGKFIGDAWRRSAILIVFFASGIAGAVAYAAIAASNFPLFGAYPAIYGLIGAYTYLLWLRLGRDGGPRWRAFVLIGFFLTFQILWGLMLKLVSGFGWIAADPTPYMLYNGIADLAGFAVGLALSPLLGPGGWQAFVGRMRQRSD